MIVAKAVNMAKKMKHSILGLVEAMSYLECPDCGRRISVFGESRIDEVAKENETLFSPRSPIGTQGLRRLSMKVPWVFGSTVAGRGGKSRGVHLRGVPRQLKDRTAR